MAMAGAARPVLDQAMGDAHWQRTIVDPARARSCGGMPTRCHVVMFSGGISSWAAARRIADEHGTGGLVLLFADTKMEDEDNYRFLPEAAANVGAPLVTIADGRDPWQVFHDERFLGNTRIDPCSKILKRELLRRWVTQHCDPAATTIVLGLDWTEGDRLVANRDRWAPWTVRYPLAERPYKFKAQWLDQLRAEGIEPPRLYGLGFAHANCLHPDTRFITDEGIRSLRDCLGKTVKVLGKGGGWRDAEIRSFGDQPTWRIRLQRYGDEKTVIATADHLWPVRKAAGRTDYRWVATDALRSSNRIAGMYGRVRHNVRPSSVGVAAGFTFGDGNVPKHSSGQVTPARAFLCGDKDKALLPYFASCRITTDDRGVVTAHDLPRAWKRHPDLDESQTYLYGWLAGYFAADGTMAGGMARLSSARRENLEVVREVCVRLGIGTNPIRTEMRRGYGAEETALHTVSLLVSTLRADFFIIPEHRKRFMKRSDETPRPADWQVIEVVPTGRVEEVMCAVVPDGNVFTLEDNLLTHNCGGACVKAGQGSWALLLEAMPERYADHERREQALREYLGKDVAILRDRQGGDTRPLTLREFRERRQAGWQCDLFDLGGCGCVA